MSKILSFFVKDVLARELQTAKSVGKVTRVGGADREIKVELDPDRLLALGITTAEVSNQLRATNIDLGGSRGDTWWSGVYNSYAWEALIQLKFYQKHR